MEKLFLAGHIYDGFWSSLIGMSFFGAESQNFGARLVHGRLLYIPLDLLHSI